VCIADVLGRSLPKVFFLIFRPRFHLNLSLGFLFLFDWINSTHHLGFHFGRRFTSIEVMPHTTLLAVVEWETGFATQQ
jgi:hypothetical protein